MNIGLWWNGAPRLISYKPSNQRHAGATLAVLGICNKWRLCQHLHCWMQGSSVFWFSTCHPRGIRGARVRAKMFSIHCYLFPSIMYFYGSRMTFIFHPQHLVIINLSLIPLCWLHVTPYLPLNTLSPINIFQISPDTICRIQMKPSRRLPAPCCLSSERMAFS